MLLLQEFEQPGSKTTATPTAKPPHYSICVTAVAMAAVASTATGGAALLIASAAAEGLAGRRLCMSASTPVNSASAPLWCAAPRDTGT